MENTYSEFGKVIIRIALQNVLESCVPCTSYNVGYYSMGTPISVTIHTHVKLCFRVARAFRPCQQMCDKAISILKKFLLLSDKAKVTIIKKDNGYIEAKISKCGKFLDVHQ